MVKKGKKTEILGLRLTKELRRDMDTVKHLYGLSFSNQISIAVKEFHKTISDE